jgi:glyoxylase-like metal-dependent hydrolase (beta-lactamase superfamily II)
MPAEVKILVQGYTNADSDNKDTEERTCATITLVKDGDLVMVVDPGVLERKEILMDALAKEGLTVEDVNMVCITHSHVDHYRNIGMFPNAKALEFFGLWSGNTVTDWSEQFSPNVQIKKTSGHDTTSITLFVTTSNGVVAICGDVFWKENYPDKDPYASEHEALQKSRELVIKMADWIIPGHGGMYKAKNVDPVDEENLEEKAKLLANGIKICKKCRRPMKKNERCICNTKICFRCCECGLDCELCSCSHKRK